MSDTFHTISQIITFGPQKRVDLLLHLLGRSRDPNPLVSLRSIDTIWARHSAHNVVSSPVIGARLCLVSLRQ